MPTTAILILTPDLTDTAVVVPPPSFIGDITEAIPTNSGETTVELSSFGVTTIELSSAGETTVEIAGR